MDPLIRKRTDQMGECCNSEPHITIRGIGLHKEKDYVILHGFDVEMNKEYWIKVSKEDISRVNSAIIDSLD